MNGICTPSSFDCSRNEVIQAPERLPGRAKSPIEQADHLAVAGDFPDADVGVVAGGVGARGAKVRATSFSATKKPASTTLSSCR